MTRRNNEPTFGADKAKVRVFYAEVEGNNESVQDALKTMLAMSRPVRVISDQKTNGNAAVLLQHRDIDIVEEAIDQVEEVGTPDGELASPPNARKPRGTGRKVDRNAGLKLVPDLDFRPDGKQALKEFVDEKSPKKDLDATLVLVYYMQHVMELPKIGPAHVMTAFKDAGKAVPVDVNQTIRNLKNRKIWLNFTDIEDVRTTTQGENFVEHEIGKDK